ncbi:MAG TPA: hypothetical protein VGF99_17445 [Myxococcota bacterium]
MSHTKHVVAAAFTLSTALWSSSSRADCLGPPDFDTWCSTGAQTGVVVRPEGDEIVVGTVYGAEVEGVVVDEPLVLACGTAQSCNVVVPSAMLLLVNSTGGVTTITSAITMPLGAGSTLQFPNAANGVFVDDAVGTATRNWSDPSLCVESLYFRSDTDRNQGLEDCDDSIFSSCASSSGVDAVGVVALVSLLRRRRRSR